MLASSEPSHLSGRNARWSGPYRSFRLCMWYTEYATGMPSRTRSGERPSGPPPTGRVVVFLQKRVLIGTGGYNRSAKLYCQQVCGGSLEWLTSYFPGGHCASRAFAECALFWSPSRIQQHPLFHSGVSLMSLDSVEEGDCKWSISTVFQ